MIGDKLDFKNCFTYAVGFVLFNLSNAYLFAMPPCLKFWQNDFLSIVDHLLADHDDSQLLGQLNQTTPVAAL
jgi:hypothetical protein